MGRIVIGIIALFLIIAPFSTPIIDGIKAWRTNDTTQAEVVVTGAGVTTANVTLDYELYQAATAEVQSITSNETADNPAAQTYTESTQVLLVAGLSPSLTRTLTINYSAETDDTVLRIVGPFLGILIFGALIWGTVGGMFSGRRKSRFG